MITRHQAKYFAHELTRRFGADNVGKLAASLADAQVDLNPHQIDAALFAFDSPLSKGAILADEVGLGKTIEAGILLSQRWAEKKRKLLVIVPANLGKQWSQELADKFFLPSFILETKSFNEKIKAGELNPLDQDSIIICSYHFARAKAAYVNQTLWDLIVIDEAHRLRNVYKPANKIANTIKNAVSPFPKVLLTATPLQNSLLELFGLVSIVDEFAFGDINSFKAQFSSITSNSQLHELKTRIKPICQRTLRRQVTEYIRYTNRIPITQEFYPTPEEQRLYDLVSDYLQRPNLYALPSSQRQLMTLILRKLLASSTYAISGTLDALATKLEAATTESKVLMPNPEEALSDFETVDEVGDEWAGEDDTTEQQPAVYSDEELLEAKAEAQGLRSFGEFAKSILKNSKGQALLTALQKGFALAKEKGALEKAIIFTESTRTQLYLRDLLEKASYAGRIVLFNGSNTDAKSKEIYRDWIQKHKDTDQVTGSPSADMRAALVQYFQDDAVIMIATEAAAEGINLQFCSLVVNYDLPWNPQRIEQRIGRCHRYGQKFDVVVVNFLNKANAADQRVYQLLDEKFKLFSGVFGASDEVLGAIESGVDFEKRIVDIYQRCRSEEQIQLEFDLLQKQLEEQIDEKMRATRQKLLENFDDEVQEKLRVRLKQSSEFLNKYEGWLWQITRHFLQPFASFDDDRHSFVLTENPFPEESIPLGQYRFGKFVGDSHLYRVGHPLAQRIIKACKLASSLSWDLAFDYSTSGKNISILDLLVGKSGWLKLCKLTVSSFDTEDELIFAAVCDDGTTIDEDQCCRLITLPANEVSGEPSEIPSHLLQLIHTGIQNRRESFLVSLSEKNAGYFEREIAKLDDWAGDLKESLEAELKELDRQVKQLKREAQLAGNLEEKLNLHRNLKDLEKRRGEKRRSLFEAQDTVDARKDALLKDVEGRLQQSVAEEELFTIRWRLS